MQRPILALAAMLITLSAAVANAGPIEHRLQRQQQQIRHATVSGRLTPAEIERLRAGHRSVRWTIAEARRDGRLTPREQARIERGLDRQDLLIQRFTHNDRGHMPGHRAM